MAHSAGRVRPDKFWYRHAQTHKEHGDGIICEAAEARGGEADCRPRWRLLYNGAVGKAEAVTRQGGRSPERGIRGACGG